MYGSPNEHISDAQHKHFWEGMFIVTPLWHRRYTGKWTRIPIQLIICQSKQDLFPQNTKYLILIALVAFLLTWDLSVAFALLAYVVYIDILHHTNHN